jgi:hypothetical protein
LPNTTPNTTGGTGDLPWSGSSPVKSSLVDIPSDFPPGTYTVRAKATIEGLGKQACEVKVDVAPTP